MEYASLEAFFLLPSLNQPVFFPYNSRRTSGEEYRDMKLVITVSVIMFIGFVALTIFVTSKAYSRKHEE
jgi:hypothetical protein